MHRCSVLGILRKYNVAIPLPVSNLLTVCPGSFDRRLLGYIHYEGREEDKEFHSFRKKDLEILHEELQQFLTLIGNAHLIDFMVHFSMCNSQIFAQYLKKKVGLQQSLTPKEHAVPSVFEGLEVFTSELHEGATAECSDKSRCAIQVSSVCMVHSIYGSQSSCKFIYIHSIQSVKMTSCYSFSHVLCCSCINVCFSHLRYSMRHCRTQKPS